GRSGTRRGCWAGSRGCRARSRSRPTRKKRPPVCKQTDGLAEGRSRRTTAAPQLIESEPRNAYEGRRQLLAHKGAQRIRNIAIVGHRGSGKTSLNEAILYEAGVINRLGTVGDGTTVSDSEPDEAEREMSISASLSSFEHDDRKINLTDTPGDPSFVADA